jgi:hypothetical protein
VRDGESTGHDDGKSYLIRHQCSGIVYEALPFENRNHVARELESAGAGYHGYGVGRRNYGTEDKTCRQGERREQKMCGPCDDDHRREYEGDGKQRDRAQIAP